MTKVSPTMRKMLRRLAAQPNGTGSCPYKRGAANTAKALQYRGLVHMWANNGGYMLSITDSGRAVLTEGK